MKADVCFGIQNDCYNVMDSYGEICVGCNCCGLFDKSTMYQCRIATDKRHLEEEQADIDNPDYPDVGQQENIRKNIEWLQKKIAESEEMVRKQTLSE